MKGSRIEGASLLAPKFKGRCSTYSVKKLGRLVWCSKKAAIFTNHLTTRVALNDFAERNSTAIGFSWPKFFWQYFGGEFFKCAGKTGKE